MDVKVFGRITKVVPIARGHEIDQYDRLVRMYGAGQWLKMRGQARVQFPDGSVGNAEVHWYEAQGAKQRRIELKIKRPLR